MFERAFDHLADHAYYEVAQIMSRDQIALSSINLGLRRCMRVWSLVNECQIRAAIKDCGSQNTIEIMEAKLRILSGEQKDFIFRVVDTIDDWCMLTAAHFEALRLEHSWATEDFGLDAAYGNLQAAFKEQLKHDRLFLALAVRRMIQCQLARNLSKYLHPRYELVCFFETNNDLLGYRGRQPRDYFDLSIVSTLPDYESLRVSVMGMPEVVARIMHATYTMSLRQEPAIRWQKYKPGRSLEMVLKAFLAARFLEYGDKTCGPYTEKQFRRVLEYVSCHPGFSQLPDLELSDILRRAMKELKFNGQAWRKRSSTYYPTSFENDPKYPITSIDLDRYIEANMKKTRKTRGEVLQKFGRLSGQAWGKRKLV